MKTLYSWMPDDAATERDQHKLRKRTAEAIRALVHRTAPTYASVVNGILHELRATAQVCHPDVFHWYFQFKNEALHREDLLKQVKGLPKLVRQSHQRAARSQRDLGFVVDTAPIGAGVASALQRGAEYAARLASEPIHLKPVETWTPEMKQRIKEALSLISSVWPEAYDELPHFVQKFVVYRGHAVIGFTDFRYHGSIFFKHEWLMHREHLDEVAEDLVHEAAHVRLNALMGTTPLFRNDDSEIYSSPLRRDLRSMYGVFHQMYVLRRVIELYRRLQARGLLCRRANLDASRGGFEEAFKVVKENADLTMLGRTMLKSMQPCTASRTA